MASNYIPNVITVEFQELDGSPEETYTENGFRAVCHYKCEWDDRHTLCQELKGGVRTVGGDTIIVMPHPYPHSGAPDGCVCRSAGIVRLKDCQIQAEDAAQQYACYPHAEVIAEYVVPEWTTGDGEPDGDAPNSFLDARQHTRPDPAETQTQTSEPVGVHFVLFN